MRVIWYLLQKIDQFQFAELNKRLMWFDFGANLVQHPSFSGESITGGGSHPLQSAILLL